MRDETVALPPLPVPGDECSTFLHYFSGPAKFGLGEAISAAAARRGVKVRVINRDILRDGADLLADEPFSSDFAAALNGHFDGFHSGFPCSSFRFRPGGPPPVRGTVSTCEDVRRTVECSRSKRRKGHCWQRGRRLWYVRSGKGMTKVIGLRRHAPPQEAIRTQNSHPLSGTNKRVFRRFQRTAKWLLCRS